MKETTTELMNDFSKLILAIVDDCDFDPLWRRFYQIQMYSYILAKRNLDFNLEEAEEAYDLIVKSWTDLKNYIEKPVFDISDLDNIFKNVIIDFPVDELMFVSK